MKVFKKISNKTKMNIQEIIFHLGKGIAMSYDNRKIFQIRGNTLIEYHIKNKHTVEYEGDILYKIQSYCKYPIILYEEII